MSPILQFKAGRVGLDESTLKATPKRGQGLVTIDKNPDDPMLFSFVWEPRGSAQNLVGAGSSSGESDDRLELLLFPGDAKWVHVPQCKTGRVFALKFRSGGPPPVFWMQNLNGKEDISELSEEDKRIATKMAEILEESEEVEEEEPEQAKEEEQEEEEDKKETANRGHEDLDVEMENAEQEEQDHERIQLTELIRNIATRAQQNQQEPPILSIADALPPSVIVDYVNGLSAAEVEELCSFLPEGIPHTKDQLCKVIYSSYFRQGMDSFSHVLNSAGVGQMVASQLDYDYEGEGVEGMLKGIRKRAKRDDEKK